MAYGLKNLRLSGAIAKENSFLASYSNRIVKLWSYSCSIAPSPLSLQLFFKQTLFDHLRTSFDIGWPCTRTIIRTRSCHKL